MVRLQHTSQVQQFALTLTELSTLVNPIYLLVFVCDMTRDVQAIVLPDMSNRKGRYNLFELSGTFFNNEGWHSYTVYEQESEDNTDPAQTTGIVERGRVFIEGISTTEFIENNSTQNNFKEYAG